MGFVPPPGAIVLTAFLEFDREAEYLQCARFRRRPVFGGDESGFCVVGSPRACQRSDVWRRGSPVIKLRLLPGNTNVVLRVIRASYWN